MPDSQTHSDPVTPSSSTVNTPSVSTTKPYSEIAASFPEPTITTPEDVQHTTPDIQPEYTIPGDHIDPTELPWNAAGMTWRSWRSKFSTIAALYVLAARHAAPPTNERRTIHAVFSPPQDDVRTHRSIRYWRAKATEISQDAGIRAGMAAFHGFRVNNPTVQEFKTHIETTPFKQTATDVLLWEWLRRSEWRNHVHWGPHIHIVGLCDYLEPYRGDGLLHRLRTFKQYDQGINTRAVAEHRAVAKDIIDHVTFNTADPLPPLAWFGELEGNRWWSANETVDDETLDAIRDQLINCPSNPDA
jgi:hypothetical protein